MIPILVAFVSGWDGEGGAAPQGGKSGYNVELVGWVDSVGEVSSLAASEDGKVVYASAGDSRDSLVIIDISDPANPYIYKRIGHDSLGCSSVTVMDTFLYVWWNRYLGVWVSELWVMDITDPLNPVLANVACHYENSTKDSLEWWPRSIYPHPSIDTIFYAVGGLKSFSISDPLNPTLISYAYAETWVVSFEFPFPYSFHISYQGTPYSYWEVWDLSDPSNMFLVHGGSVYEEYEWPTGIAAWEYNGGRYLYLHGGTFDYSFDVTDPTDPVQLNWGARDPQLHWGMVHGTRLYVTESGPWRFGVYDLTNPVYIPEVGWYYDSTLSPWNNFLWVNGYVVAETVTDLGINGLAIYHYIYDTIIPPDTADTTDYLEWVRTVYGGPELTFSLRNQAQVSFSLFNSAGQRAYDKDLGLLGAGPHTISLPGLKPGVYFLELKINNEVISKKLVFTQEGSFLEPEERPDYGPGYLFPPPWEALGHRGEEPEREIRVLPLSFSCKDPAEMILYGPDGKTGKLSLSPELADSLFRMALVNHVLKKGFCSWIPGLEAVLYSGDGVYAPGYYRMFYLDPPVKISICSADTIALCGKGAMREQGGYPFPVEDITAPYAMRIYGSNGADFYARVILLPDPSNPDGGKPNQESELFARVRIHLWATEGITPYKGLAPGITRDFDLRIMRDGVIAGDGAR